LVEAIAEADLRREVVVVVVVVAVKE